MADGRMKTTGWEARAAVSVITLLSMALVALAVDFGLRISGFGSLSPLPSPGHLDFSAGPAGGFAPLDAGFVDRFLGRGPGPPSADVRSRAGGGATPRSAQVGGTAHLISHRFTNDRFADAYRVPSVPFRAETSTAGATAERGEPASCASPLGGKTAWYTFTTPRRLSLLADTLGTSYASALTVYRGSSVSTLTPVAPCNSDARGNAMVAFTAEADATYYFQIDGSLGGHLVFSLQQRGVTTRASVGSDGRAGEGDSLIGVLSGDGSEVMFVSGSSTFDPGPRTTPCAPSGVAPCGKVGAYVRDRRRHVTTNVYPAQSVAASETDVGSLVIPAAISDDGRYRTFFTTAKTQAPGSNPNQPSSPYHFELFRRDNRTGEIERVSVPCDGCGTTTDGSSARGEMSADGRYVAFVSWATNLVPGDTNLVRDVFVRDMVRRTTHRVSVPDRTQPGREGDGIPSSSGDQGADLYSISRDGRRVVFKSSAPNLVANDTNRATDVFMRDELAGTTERVNVSSAGIEANQDSRSVTGFGLRTISDDGRFVYFNSDATNLVSRPTNGKENVYRRDLWLRTTTLMTVSSTGVAANDSVGSTDYRQTLFTYVAPILVAGRPNVGLSSLSYSATADGRYVVFSSDADNLVPGDSNTKTDVFMHDAHNASTIRVSVSSDGAEAERGDSGSPTISADGTYVAFHSTADNLVANDDNASSDVFVREMPRPGANSGWS
ncbi:MAG TPA: hypothetical protein VM121_06000 [Acidimicrobiales bacterium]|nr:hypothetical protein [Acidimicrobiales bacterium]